MIPKKGEGVNLQHSSYLFSPGGKQKSKRKKEPVVPLGGGERKNYESVLSFAHTSISSRPGRKKGKGRRVLFRGGRGGEEHSSLISFTTHFSAKSKREEKCGGKRGSLRPILYTRMRGVKKQKGGKRAWPLSSLPSI